MDFSTKPSFNQCCPDCQNNKRLFKKIKNKLKEMFIDFNLLTLHLGDLKEDTLHEDEEEDRMGT